MTQVAIKSTAVYGEALNKTRVQIQKPEVSTYRPSVPAKPEVSTGFGWKMMVVLTYLLNIITLYFVFSV